jgi:hypothetical protein
MGVGSDVLIGRMILSEAPAKSTSLTFVSNSRDGGSTGRAREIPWKAKVK